MQLLPNLPKSMIIIICTFPHNLWPKKAATTCYFADQRSQIVNSTHWECALSGAQTHTHNLIGSGEQLQNANRANLHGNDSAAVGPRRKLRLWDISCLHLLALARLVLWAL